MLRNACAIGASLLAFLVLCSTSGPLPVSGSAGGRSNFGYEETEKELEGFNDDVAEEWEDGVDDDDDDDDGSDDYDEDEEDYDDEDDNDDDDEEEEEEVDDDDNYGAEGEDDTEEDEAGDSIVKELKEEDGFEA